MGKCERIRKLAAGRREGALSPREERRLERHLRSCPACAADIEAMEATVRLMKSRTRPDPGPEFWKGYWDRLEARLDALPAEAVPAGGPKRRKPSGGFIGRLPRWAFAAAAGLLILYVGIRIGRRMGPGPAVPAAAPAVRAGSLRADPVLAGEVKEYFSRSKVILLALANFDSKAEDPYALNLAYQKQVSRELVDRGRVLESRLRGPDARRFRGLIGDLEPILVQVANLDAGDDVQAVEIVRNGVRLRGILFKISISEMALAEAGPKSDSPETRPITDKKGDRL